MIGGLELWPIAQELAKAVAVKAVVDIVKEPINSGLRKALSWLRERLPADDQAKVDAAHGTSDSGPEAMALAVAIHAALKNDPDAAKQLRAWLDEAGETPGSMTQIGGGNAKQAQIQGSGNTVTIS
jgi:hypothetical protein